ncbi:hypothetical protein GCM10008969_55780 [Pseudomonas veronii subsp. inensis]
MPAQTLRLSDRQLKGVKPASKDYVLTDGDGLLNFVYAATALCCGILITVNR